MFTGIIREIGKIKIISTHSEGVKIEVETPSFSKKLQEGDSIAVNGVCLTVCVRTEESFTADVVKETLSCTTLGSLQVGDSVNLERPLALTDLLDGHLVQGHVDGVGEITHKETQADGSVEMSISCSPELTDYMVPKGSIALDGISLTLVRVEANSLTVALIPHTQKLTTLGLKCVGEKVNLEVDIIAKYVNKRQLYGKC